MFETIRIPVLEAEFSCKPFYMTISGDETYRLLTVCLESLTLAVQRNSGTVMHSEGASPGNLSAAFLARLPDADAAAAASVEFMRRCPGMQTPESGPPKARIGFHFGDAVHRKEDDFFAGPAFTTANMLMRRAHSGRILTSGATVEHLSAAWRPAARMLESVDTKHGPVELRELLWRD